MNQETRPAPAGFSEQQLHTLFELISDGIWDWNANTGYVYRNPAGTRCSATPATPWPTRY